MLDCEGGREGGGVGEGEGIVLGEVGWVLLSLFFPSNPATFFIAGKIKSEAMDGKICVLFSSFALKLVTAFVLKVCNPCLKSLGPANVC